MSPSSEVFQVFYYCHKKNNIGMSSSSLKMNNWGFQQVPFFQLQESKIDPAPSLLLWSCSTWRSSPFVLNTQALCQRICLVYRNAKLSALHCSRTESSSQELWESFRCFASNMQRLSPLILQKNSPPVSLSGSSYHRKILDNSLEISCRIFILWIFNNFLNLSF